MTAPHPAPSTQHLLVPELGPALGRLTTVPGARVSAPPAPRDDLADLRLGFVGRLFDLGAAARRAADAEAAAAIITPGRLRHEWERAAALVADRVVGRLGASLKIAGERSGISARRLRKAMLTPEETALLRARLLGTGVPFTDGLSALDVAEAGSPEWGEALLDSMRCAEECWLRLEQGTVEEQEAWSEEILRLASWHPSPWPRRLAAAGTLILCLYAGLVLGGFLPVPAFLRPAADWWWQHGG